MTQLPSVSELLIGAQTSKPESQRPKKSGTSPRQPDAYAGHEASRASDPPSKRPRVTPSPRAYSGMTATERQHSSHQGRSHQNAHDAHASANGGTHNSSASSARNSVSSNASDSQMQAALPPSSADYQSHHNGASRSRNVQQYSSHSSHSSPQLHYRQRHDASSGTGASSGLVTRVPSYQSFGSPEIVNHAREPQSPYAVPAHVAGESSHHASRPRPASFSYASGPAPMSAPGASYYGAAKQYHGHAPNSNSQPGNPQIPHGYAQAPPPTHYQVPPPVPMAYYNGPTAGGGYAPNYYAPSAAPGQYPGAVHGAYPGAYPGAVPGPGYISNGAYLTPEAPVPGSYGHEYYAPAQYRPGQMPGAPYSQMDAMIRQPQHHYPIPGGSSDDLASLASDPNHALINKRCIIKRRTRTGCLTCRKRRIKCDERKPHCFNCERSKKLCLGYEISTNSNNAMTYTLDIKPENNSSSESVGENGHAHLKNEQTPVERQRSSVHDLM